jgi:hypothetical protein
MIPVRSSFDSLRFGFVLSFAEGSRKRKSGCIVMNLLRPPDLGIRNAEAVYAMRAQVPRQTAALHDDRD